MLPTAFNDLPPHSVHCSKYLRYFIFLRQCCISVFPDLKQINSDLDSDLDSDSDSDSDLDLHLDSELDKKN